MAENTGSQFNIYPMDQFIIEPIVKGSNTLQWYSFSNQTLWMVICFFSIALVFIFGTRQNKIIPGRFQSIAEIIYNFVYIILSIILT